MSTAGSAPLNIPLGPLQIFCKFSETFLNECLSAVSKPPAIKPCHGFSVFAGVSDTGDNYRCTVKKTGRKINRCYIRSGWRSFPSTFFTVWWERHRWTIIAGDNDTGHQWTIIAGVYNDTGDKFIAGDNDNGEQLSLMSLTVVINWSPVTIISRIIANGYPRPQS